MINDYVDKKELSKEALAALFDLKYLAYEFEQDKFWLDVDLLHRPDYPSDFFQEDTQYFLDLAKWMHPPANWEQFFILREKALKHGVIMTQFSDPHEMYIDSMLDDDYDEAMR